MRSIFFFLAATLLFALSSCSEDDNYPQKFSRYEFSSGEVKMHTKTGVVTDAQVISQFTNGIRNYFLNSENLLDYVYSFNDDINQFENYDLELIFSSEIKGELSFKSKDAEAIEKIKFNLVKKDDYYIVSMQDTVVSSLYSENARFKCRPEMVKREPIPMGGEIVSYLRPLYIKKGKDEISVCIVSYMENSYFNNELVGIAISGPENNLINTDYLMGLMNTSEGRVDSIAYKESFIIFKK